MLSKERILEFCKKQKIWIPNKSATLKELTAIVARWALDGDTIDRKTCFGLLDTEANDCLSCDFRKNCFKVSFGIDEEKYWKRIDKADKINIDF